MPIQIYSLAMLIFACESDKGVVVYNTPPDVNIISHSDEDEVFEGYPVEFRAVLSDVNHNTDQLTARWKINGEEVCPFLPPDISGESTCVATIYSGDEDVSVEVRDPDNASDQDSIFLNIVPTQPPVAQILRPEEEGIFYSDFPIILEGIISDAEDDVEELVYQWSSNIDGTLEIQSDIENDGTIKGDVYLSAGNHVITLRVEDKTEKADSDEVTIVVGGPNSAPSCEITSPSPNSVGPVGELVTFLGQVEDADISHSLLEVSWSSDKDGEIGVSIPDTSGNVIFPYSDLSINTHVISMTVLDEKGAECVSNLVYTVSTPPNVTITSPSNTIYNEGETVNFSAMVSDNEDQPNEISLEWTTSDGTVLHSQSATSDGNVEFVLQDMPYGQHVVTLTGTDTDGLTSSDLVSFTINALPTQPSLTVIPSNPKTGDDITATATGSTDSDGGNVTYSYEWVYGSNTVTGSALSPSQTSKGQVWTVTATPNDGTADGIPVSQNVTIENTTPDSLVVTIIPNFGVYNDSELTCSATANDDDTSDSLEYSYAWSTTQTSETITLNDSMSPTDNVTCTVTASDGTDSIVASTNITIENRDPVLSNISIASDGYLWDDTTLTCSVDVLDTDGEIPDISYSWTLSDGTTTVEGNTLTLENVSSGDVFTCTAVAEDDFGGTDAISDNIVIANTLPVVDSITFSETSIYTNDIIVAEVVLSDADAFQSSILQATYSWFVIDFQTGLTTEVQSGMDNTLSGIDHFDKNDEVYVVVTPNDGWENGQSVTSVDSISVLNSPPVISEVNVTPNPASAGAQDLICDVTAVDDDAEDSILYTYIWTDPNGVEHQTNTDVFDNFDAYLFSNTSEGTWICAVTPYDGSDYGIAQSDQTIVESGCRSMGFDGIDDGIQISSSSMLSTFSSAMTVEAWVKWENTGATWYPILQQGWGTNDSLFYFGLTGTTEVCGATIPGVPYFEFKSSPTDVDGCLAATNVLQPGKWTHIAVTYDAGTIRFFVQGKQKGEKQLTTNTLFSPAPADPYIGYSITSNHTYYTGNILSIHLNRSVLYTQDFVVPLELQPDIDSVGLWNLHHSSATTVLDATGNGHNGIINGPTLENTCPEEDLDNDQWSSWQDCNDGNPDMHPFAGDTYGDGVDTDCDKFDCEAAYDGNDVYFSVCIETTEQDFSTVESHCLNSGYDGVSLPLNDVENDWVFLLSQSIWSQKPISNYSIRLGGTDADVEGVWLHDRTGIELSYLNWPASGTEPTNSFGNEHCINMIGDVSYNGSWQDLGCHVPSNAAYAWSCEKR